MTLQKKKGKYIAWFNGLQWGWVGEFNNDWIWVSRKKDAFEFLPDGDWNAQDIIENLEEDYPNSKFNVED
jgi:hypothetical protein